LTLIHPNAAAMDISADEIVVAVPPDRDPTPLRNYRTFTPDLDDLVTSSFRPVWRSANSTSSAVAVLYCPEKDLSGFGLTIPDLCVCMVRWS